MKSVVIAVCVMLFAAMHAPDLLANEAKDIRDEADQYYQELNFKKAYKLYYKLAKVGDRYSQDQVSYMYANGEGKSADMTEAYAWSVVAAESGKEEFVNKSNDLLLHTKNQEAAEKRAAKLVKKYGKDAQKVRASRLASKENNKRSGVCTGTRLACSRG